MAKMSKDNNIRNWCCNFYKYTLMPETGMFIFINIRNQCCNIIFRHRCCSQHCLDRDRCNLLPFSESQMRSPPSLSAASREPEYVNWEHVNNVLRTCEEYNVWGLWTFCHVHCSSCWIKLKSWDETVIIIWSWSTSSP